MLENVELTPGLLLFLSGCTSKWVEVVEVRGDDVLLDFDLVGEVWMSRDRAQRLVPGSTVVLAGGQE